MRLILLFLAFFVYTSFGAEISINRTTFYTGDIGKVFIKNFQGKHRYQIVIKDKKIRLVFPVVSKVGYFGIPVFAGKKAKLYIKKDNKVVFAKTIFIKRKKYPISRITVKERKLTKKLIKRIRRENKLLRRIFKVYTKKLFREKYMKKPLKKLVITTPFGARRIINNKKRSIHWGTDFKGRLGEPIFASLSGRVVLARNLYYTGNTVVINHGLGLYTLYAHMSKINVKEGQFVKAGQIIGKVGSTGRSTAPHLHFGVYINDVKVDPMLLLKKKL